MKLGRSCSSEPAAGFRLAGPANLAPRSGSVKALPSPGPPEPAEPSNSHQDERAPEGPVRARTESRILAQEAPRDRGSRPWLASSRSCRPTDLPDCQMPEQQCLGGSSQHPWPSPAAGMRSVGDRRSSVNQQTPPLAPRPRSAIAAGEVPDRGKQRSRHPPRFPPKGGVALRRSGATFADRLAAPARRRRRGSRALRAPPPRRPLLQPLGTASPGAARRVALVSRAPLAPPSRPTGAARGQ